MTHFLQSHAWKHFQEMLGRQVIRTGSSEWSYQAIEESGTGNVRLYAPYGPTFTSVDAFDAAITSLKNEAISRGASFLRIEPISGITEAELKTRGFKAVTYQQLQPAHTLVIDLSLSKDDILAGMSQNSRNITRNYRKKGVVIHSSYDLADITILTSLLKGVSRRNHIRTQSDTYLKTQAEALFPTKSAVLYYATLEDTPIAAALVYDDNTTRYYAHAAADDTYRKLSAGTALVGQMILDAKESGLKQFDLYGIAPDDSPTHPWYGFTKFKRSFGGTPLTYLGAWDLPLKPVRYYIYRLYQTIRSALK
jgi:lipid II:glycine glycyltransferase (peptidoglycan interpeptide bridge formation enzyme)